MRSWKRLISLLLVFAMTASYLPAPAYAEDVVEEIVEEVVEETAVEVISEEVAEEVMEETEEIEDITEDVVEEVIEEVPEEMPEEIIFDRVSDSVAAADETGFAPADGAVVSYDLTVASQQVTSAALEGTGWRYDPEANVLYLDSAFESDIYSELEWLIVEVSGTVSCNGITAKGNLTLQGETDKDTDALIIGNHGYYEQIKVYGDELTVRNMRLSVTCNGLTAILVGTTTGSDRDPCTGSFTIENAWVSGSSRAYHTSSCYIGILAGNVNVLGASRLAASTEQPGLSGIDADYGSFSAESHVSSTYSIRIDEVTAPEGFINTGSSYYEKFDGVSGDSVGSSEYLGIDHGVCTQNADGETHTLECPCSSYALNSRIFCYGAPVCGQKSVCASCGGEYGEVNDHIFDKETHKCSCGAIGGWCGDYATWELDEATGVLTVSGRADMYDYASAYDQPWKLYRDKIRSVVIGDEITAVGDYAFGGTGAHEACLNLTEVTLGKKVMGIGSLAFGFCEFLEKIVLPDSVTRVDESAFAECLALSDVTLSRNLKKITGFTGCKSLKTIEIPEGVTEVGGFQYSGLTSITLPESVTTISDYAFDSCMYLTEVNLPQSLTTIDRYAFNDCLQLTNVTIPAGVKTIGDYAFGYGYSSKVHIFHFEGDAPTISATAFQSKTATAYYPADKSGWTSYKLQNYGGKSITWIAVYPTGGTCGDNVTWSFEEATGVLTISGTGAMDDYSYYTAAPWDCLGEKIREVVVESGVTAVGSNAFSGYENLTKVTLEDTVTAIGSGAFSDLLLTSIDLSNVTELGRYAFSNCSYLSQVTFGEGLKEIPNSAFEECHSLVRVELPESVTSIGEMSFTCCNGLTEVVLPDSLTSIGYMAFADCDLRTVTLPKNLQYLDDYAFVGNYDLTEITFTGNAPAFHEYALFDITATAYYPADGEGWAEAVKNQYGAEELTWVAVQPTSGTCGEDATWSFDEVSGVLTISGTGSTYDYSSFSDLPPWVCWAEDITKVVVASGITRLGNYAFRTVDNSYTKLTDVELADSVICIGTSAFINLETLTYINLSHVTELEFNAFFSCGSLETVVFNDDMQTIGNGAFTYCDSLKNVQLPQNLKRIEPAAFAYCANAFTDLVIPEGVTFIGNMAFYGCDSMESLVIPGTVSQINPEAFAKNPGLKKITFLGSAPYITEPIFGDVEATAYYPGNDTTWTEEVRQSYGGNITWVPVYPISGTCGTGVYWKFDASTGTLTTYGEGYLDGYYAPPWLYWMNQIKHVVVEEGVCSVRNGGFMNAVNLETVEIADTVTYIGGAAFSDCASLEEITIPASVTSFEKNVFNGSGLKTITFLGSAPELQSDAIFGTITATAYYPAGDESWTEEVRQSYGGNITWVPVENIIASGICGDKVHWKLNDQGTMTIYGSGDMVYAENWEEIPWHIYKDQICRVVVEDGVTNVMQYAFQDYDNLESVSLGADVKIIGWSAFAHCDALKELKFGAGLKEISDSAFSYCQGLTDAPVLPQGLEVIGHSAFNNCTAMSGTLIIPDSVTTIDNFAFYQCAELEAVKLGSGLKTINYMAFTDCTGLEELLNIPESLETIGDYAFSNCEKMEGELILTGVKSIGSEAFYGCEKLQKLELGSSLETLGKGAFNYCRSMKGDIVLPEAITVIPESLFDFCEDLESITILGDLTSIGERAFFQCYDLTFDMELKEGLTSIGSSAFSWCQKLTGDLVIPASVKEIGYSAFAGCSGLTSLTFAPGCSIKYIDVCTFQACSSLTGEIVLPETVKTIDECAFMHDEKITAVRLGSNVEQIGEWAFGYCDALEEITFTGDAPEFDGDAPFQGVTANAVYPSDNETWTEDVRKDYGGHITWVPDGEPVAVSVSVSAQPAKTKYVRNLETLDLTGGKLTLVYSDGTEEIVDMTADMVSGFDNSQSGEQTLVVTCQDCTTTLTVWVLATDGQWGTNLHWSLATDGTLTISGNGPMRTYENPPAGAVVPSIDGYPWHHLIDRITSVAVEEGVTTLGYKALMNLEKLTSVTLPESLTTLEAYAIANCPALEELVIPKNVSVIDYCVFREDTGLKTVTFNGNAPTFKGCAPTYVPDAFSGVTAEVRYPADATGWENVVTDQFGGTITWVPYGEVEVTDSGECGEDLTWELTSDGVLTISGTGRMYDYSAAPWYDYKDLIKAVELSEGITYIGGYAFSELDITEIKLPGTVTEIGNDAFRECKELTDVTLNNGLMYIGDQAFNTCEKLEEIVFPDSLCMIGSYAFAWIPNLKHITMSMNIGQFGWGAFAGASGLKNLTFLGSAPWFTDPTFDETVELEIRYPADDITWKERAGNDYGGHITWVPVKSDYIAQGICGPEAYWKLGHDGVLTVYGSGETDIATFSSANRWDVDHKDEIISIVVEEGITSLDYGLFRNLVNVTSIELADSITVFKESVFTNSKVETLILPENLTVIGDYAFQNCTNLKQIVIPDSVETVGAWAFLGCNMLESVTIGKGVKTIKSNAFENCTALTTLNLNSEVLETVGENAFHNCSAITGNLIFPETLVSIGADAFSGCTALDGSVVIPGGTLGTNAFGNVGMKALTLGNGITDISNWAFYQCTALAELILPNTLQTIGNDAFSRCTALTGTLTIPDSVTAIGDNAFSECTGLTGLVLGSNLETIGAYAFFSCTGLKTLSGIPQKLKSIGDSAFWYCTNMACELKMPDSLENIGAHAFYYCGEIEKLTLGTGLKTIGQEAFSNCTKMEGNIKIPEGVTEIPQGAFEQTLITGLTIPSSVTAIGVNAFDGCRGLYIRLRLPEGLKTIGNNAFRSCEYLYGTLTIPSTVTSIGKQAFGWCKNLTGLVLEGEVTSQLETIGEMAFVECNAMSGSLVIPESVEKIGKNAFSNMYGITELKLNNTMTEIPMRAFAGLELPMEEIVIPDNIQQIGAQAFGWTKIKKIVLGKNLERLGTTAEYDSTDSTFCYCTETEELIFTGKEFYAIYGDLKTMTKLKVIRIPWEVEADYKDLLQPRVNTDVEFRYLNFGDCGDNAAWYFNENTGVLTISGSGEMWDYAYGKTPWFCFHDEIRTVYIEETVTGIGENAFASTGLLSVALPDSIAVIGESAFYDCHNLSNITLPANLEEIPSAMFSQCDALESITIPAAVKRIGGSAFNGSGLKEITFLGEAPTFGNDGVFNNCTVTAYYTAGESWTDDVMKDYGGTVDWQTIEPDWEIDEGADQIQGVEAGMAWETLAQQLQSQGHEKPEYKPHENKKNDGLATGEIIIIGDMELTVVVTGDVDGDAVMDENDLQKIMDHVGKGGDHKLHGAYRDAGCAYKGRTPEDDINVFDIYAILDSLKAHK